MHPNGRHTDERRFHERPCIRRPRPRIAPPWIASSCQCPRLRYRHRLGRDGRATAIDVGPARGTKETEATVPRKKAPMRSTLRRYHHQPMPLRAMRQPVPVQRRLRRRTLHLPQRRLRGARPELLPTRSRCRLHRLHCEQHRRPVHRTRDVRFYHPLPGATAVRRSAFPGLLPAWLPVRS